MIRYQLALLGHSQRWLPPSFAFLVLLAILYTDPDAPILPELAVSTGAVTVAASWLTIALVDAEDPVQRLITRVHARRLSTVLGGVVVSVLICCAVLTAVSLVWSSIRHGGDPAGVLGIGVLAHLAGACTGVAIGLLCSRLLVTRIGYTVLAAPAALVVVLLLRWVPLLNPMLRAMSSGTPATGAVVVGVVTSAVLLSVSAVVVGLLFRRRS
ncbi:hypothetical protein LWP59_00140 [Amycolatopsis acidiphila]|uniref:ABC transporter n=1 Tax=Amycolatopsis acidiphila TaxID=715473 RepID=A0A558AG06_9PSEU|nr:hypothetical protein [Amycolatopsis acidiphila]TVT23156.1 hypothetical protein FNH06_11095 [Amycolatopsis acidiphila]UIJ60154.1 hypothetical protein LWP59_00140 [Amycolatopsis acidiphila]GHG61038.1 hypothetical protein GCM10017788_15350 [Amycolatopsis acidiphila]